MNEAIAITGIHTGIGKTIVSAVLALALDADYWKPVQAGELDNSDTLSVQKLIAGSGSKIHPEAIRLTEPMSPHAAAAIDGVHIDYKTFAWPQTKNCLLVETAGGVLSPMNGEATMADFVAHYKLPTILVSNNYLGSINHTLLSIEALRSRGIPILGLVMNGNGQAPSEAFIEQYAQVPIVARVPFFETMDADKIRQHALSIRSSLLAHLNNGKH